MARAKWPSLSKSRALGAVTRVGRPRAENGRRGAAAHYGTCCTNKQDSSAAELWPTAFAIRPFMFRRKELVHMNRGRSGEPAELFQSLQIITGPSMCNPVRTQIPKRVYRVYQGTQVTDQSKPNLNKENKPVNLESSRPHTMLSERTPAGRAVCQTSRYLSRRPRNHRGTHAAPIPLESTIHPCTHPGNVQ